MVYSELANAYRFRELIAQFTLRDIKAGRKQSLLGLAWIVLQPLAQMALFTAVFTLIIPVETAKPYPVFAFSGIIIWRFFAQSLSATNGCVVAHANLVRKTYFPREVLAHAKILSCLVNLGANAAVLAVMMAIYRIVPGVEALCLVPIVLIVALLAEGVGLVTAAMTVFWRDTSNVLVLVLQFWFYATPIVYPVGRVPVWLLPWYRINPMVGVVTSTRNVLLEGAPPDYASLGIAAGVSAVVFLVGFAFFKRCEPHFADLI